MEICNCLSKVIAFMPASYYVNLGSNLISSLYFFATFSSFNIFHEFNKIGLMSLDCIYELLSKASTLDKSANDLIQKIYSTGFRMHCVVVSIKQNKDIQLEINEDYLKKLIDFSKLFITNHLRRFADCEFSLNEFLVLLFEFTNEINKTYGCYLMLLETWSLYLDYVLNCINIKHEDKVIINRLLLTNKEPLFTLMSFILNSIQYSSNRDFLNQLDNAGTDDDDHMGLESYMQNSIEVVAKIGEIFPEHTIEYVYNHLFNDKFQQLYYGLELLAKKSLETQVVRTECKLFPSEYCHQPVGQLQLAIFDFITALQIYSRFANLFVDENFDRYLVHTKPMFDKLFSVLQFIDHHHLCQMSSSVNPLLNEVYLLKAQVIATFKAYIVWFQTLFTTQDCQSKQAAAYCDSLAIDGSSNGLKPDNNKLVHQYLTLIYFNCCSIICNSDILHEQNRQLQSCKQQLYHSAALTLNTFTAAIRSLFVFRLQSVQHLLSEQVYVGILRFHEVNESISLTDQILISQSISNLLVMPWFSIHPDSQQWDQRQIRINSFVNCFLQIFNKLDLSDSRPAVTQDQHKCPNLYCRSLYILKKVIQSHSDSPLKSKQLLLQSLHSSLEAFIQLLMHNRLLHTTTSGCQITEHILALFHTIFNVFVTQIHIDFVKQTIQTLFHIINTENVLAITVNDQASSQKSFHTIRVLVKFHKLLIVIVKQTAINATLRSLLPDIIEFTVVQVQNNLINPKSAISAYFRNMSGVQYEAYDRLLQVYYRFLYELLLNNQRHFFPKSNVINKFPFAEVAKPAPPPPPDNNNNANQCKLISIMQIFEQSFLQPENIAIFSQNIDALESLNASIKLYTRPVFLNLFQSRFLFLFLQILLDRSLDILNDRLYNIVYHLAEVDFKSFYQGFLPKFLSNMPQLNIHQRMELMERLDADARMFQGGGDLHTFGTKLNKLLHDIRFCSTVH